MAIIKNSLKIGLAFSGGGYRAASFNLGVLTFLDRIRTDDGSLLDHVCVLSTVSGGTITGARYAVGKKQGESIRVIYKDLHHFMTSENLVSSALQRLVSEGDWNSARSRGLISAFADIYDRELFHEAKFGVLMADDPLFHLKHLSFNATDFKTPLQFRFQWSEKLLHPGSGEPGRGIIGNRNFNIPEIVAREIRMGDIVAASSCFPGGFEPINFPNDFVFPADLTEQEVFRKIENIGLMDGGIVDNQGIEPVLLADERIHRNEFPGKKSEEDPEHSLDLIIISDVASPFMEKYVATVQKPENWWRQLTPNSILLLNNLILTGSVAALIHYLMAGKPGWAILFTVIATLNVLLDSLAVFLLYKLRKVELVRYFKNPLRNLLNLKLRVYETMLVNRMKSVMKMTGEVFLKHVRRLNYRILYNDTSWKNRLIMNAIYELVPGKGKVDEKIKSSRIITHSFPSDKIREVAEKAASMSTTLWFTGSELNPGGDEKSMPDALIACGQFNLCWNLLEYIEKIEKKRENTTANHDLIIGCKEQLLKDWERFRENPYWLVEEYR